MRQRERERPGEYPQLPVIDMEREREQQLESCAGQPGRPAEINPINRLRITNTTDTSSSECDRLSSNKDWQNEASWEYFKSADT